MMKGSESRKYEIDFDEIDSIKYKDLELKMNLKSESILNILENGFKLPQVHNQFSANVLENIGEELISVVDKNKLLVQELESKLSDISLYQKKYQSFKEDKKILSKEIKETHEAFVMTKKYYKKYLKIYYTIESKNDEKQTIFIQFFTETKMDTDKYSARFLRHSKSGHYELLETNPKIEIFKDLQKQLLATNEVPSVVYKIREAFLALKTQK